MPPQLKSFFGEHLHGTLASSHLCLFQRSIHILLPQIPSSPTFQPCSFQVPDRSASAHESVSNHTPGHFPFQTKCMPMCTVQSSDRYEDFPLPVSFRVLPERGCDATAVHFWIVPARSIEPSVNQVPVFCSSVNQALGILEDVNACSAVESIIMEIESIDSCATSVTCVYLQNLLVPKHISMC